MKICRFDDNRLGLVKDGNVYDATAALDALPSLRWPIPVGDQMIANLDTLRPLIEAEALHAEARPLRSVNLLSPVANPSKIVAAPVNYHAHLAEVRKNPGIHHNQVINTIDVAGLFLKATSSLVGASEGVALRLSDSRRNDHEIELAVVIGKKADRVSRIDACSYVAGYAIGLDMTIRGAEERSLRKSPDSYTVLGPYLVTADEIGSTGNLDFSISVNGELRQSANTSGLIFDVARLIEFASSFYTLHPGDIIMTGTPEGVGPVLPGDKMVAWMAGIGSMEVDVRLA